QSVSIGKADQASLVLVATPASVIYGSTSTLSTTGGSGTGAVTYSAGASTGCSVAGSTLSVTDASGSCAVTATKAADTDYNAVTSAVVSVTLTRAVPVITWGNPAGIVYGTALSATQLNATASVPGSFSYTPASGAVLSAGPQTLHVDFTPDDANNYTPANQDVSLTVQPASQSISFTSTAPANAVIAGPAYTPTATGGASSSPVIFSIDAAATSVCSLSGGEVSFQASGVCMIDANQAADANYTAAPQAQQSFTVSKISQSISFSSTAPATAVVSGSTYTPTAVGGASGNAVVLTVDASAASVCTLAGGVVSFLTPGNCVIDANQAGNVNYDAAPQVQQSFAVGKGSQSISFTLPAPVGAVVDGATYTPGATGGASGNAVIISIDTSAATVCALSGGAVSFQAAGLCVIDANQAGSANYNAAPQVQQSFTVGRGSQSVGFTSTAPASAVVGGSVYQPDGTGGASGNPVVFSIDAAAASVCAISSGDVSFQAVGACVIDADQAGDANYNAALQVQQSFTVGKGSQSISFISAVPVGAIIAGPAYTPSATGGDSSSPVVFTIDAAAASICSLAGGDVTFLLEGTCVIDANQAADANFTAAPQVQQSFWVSKITPVITFDAAPTPSFLGGTFTVKATTTNTDSTALSYSKVSGACAFLGETTFRSTGAGTCIVRADSYATTHFKAAAQTQHIEIDLATLALSVTNSPVLYTGAAQAAVLSAGSVDGTFSNVQYNGSATVPADAGTYAVTADFAPADSANYKSLTGAPAGSFVIQKATPHLAVTNSPVLYQGSPQAAVISSGSVAGVVGNVRYDDSPTVPTAVGVYAVTADFTPTDTTNYNSLANAAAGSFEIEYNPQAPVITWAAPADIAFGNPLSDAQLDASAGGVAGVFDYTPGAGTVLNVGTHTLHASFTPADLNNYLPASKDVSITVTPAETTTTVGSSANPAPFGQPVTLAAVVASDAGTPDGTVTFKDGAVTLGTGALSDGIAAITTSAIEAGTHAITAEFNGGGNFAGSLSDPLSQTVAPVDATVAIASSMQQTPEGQTWTFTVTITLSPGEAARLRAAAADQAASAGTVTLKDGTTILGTSPLGADGTATFVITSLSPGAHQITAEFSQGSDTPPAISPPVDVVANRYSIMLPLVMN
ncbi:MAG TPA: Ig-like domain repeat protein, partial [Armatimonadota bacterium]